MTALLFGVLFCMIGMIVESWCGAYGFFLPCGAITVFYLTVVYGWRAGLAAALAVGFGIDRIFMRSDFPSLTGTVSAVAIGMFWLWRADSRMIWLRLLPGAAIAVITVTPAVIHGFFYSGASPDHMLQGILSWCFAVLSTAIVTLVLSLVLDDVAIRLGLPQFEKARERFIHDRG